MDKPEGLRIHKPMDGGWSINEILEHVALTNHYLLILIDKGADKALRNVDGLDLKHELNNYNFEIQGLEDIGITKSFKWIRPEHMEPTGSKPLELVKAELMDQSRRCAHHLTTLKNGEGVLFKTTMSVNNLGKIDVYQYIYFLVKHAQRHIQQMEKIETDFGKKVIGRT